MLGEASAFKETKLEQNVGRMAEDFHSDEWVKRLWTKS